MTRHLPDQGAGAAGVGSTVPGVTGRSLLGGAVGLLIVVGCSGGSSVTTGATVATTGGPVPTTSVTPPSSTAPTATTTSPPTTSPARPTTVASPTPPVVEVTTSLALPSAEPSWAFAATFALGSGRIDIVDATGELVHSIETDDASFLQDPIQTVVRGRVVATKLTNESELLVLDVEAGMVHSLALSAPADARVFRVGYPRASHVLVMSSNYSPEFYPEIGYVTLSIDLTTLEVSDLRGLLPIEPEEILSEYQRTQTSAEEVALWGSAVSGRESVYFSLLFDIGSPESAQRVDGAVYDRTDDLLLTIAHSSGPGPPASTLRLLDRTLAEQWRLEVKAIVSGSILDDHRLVLSDESDLVVLDVETGEVEVVLSEVDPRGGRWVADRSVYFQSTGTGLVLLNDEVREVARFDDTPGMYSPFDDPDSAACVVLGPVPGTGFDVKPTVSDDLPMLLVALPTGNVLHEYASPPTKFSTDACTTAGGDGLTPGELVVRGTAVPLGEGEIPLAISPDGTAVLIAKGLGGSVVIRRLDGAVADVPLANPAGVGFFIEG